MKIKTLTLFISFFIYNYCFSQNNEFKTYNYFISSISEYNAQDEKIESSYSIPNCIIVLNLNASIIKISGKDMPTLAIHITNVEMVNTSSGEAVLKAFISDETYQYCLFYNTSKRIAFIPHDLTQNTSLYFFDKVQ